MGCTTGLGAGIGGMNGFSLSLSELSSESTASKAAGVLL